MDRDIQKKKKKTPAKNNVHAQELQEIKEKKDNKIPTKIRFLQSKQTHLEVYQEGDWWTKERAELFSFFFVFFSFLLSF